MPEIALSPALAHQRHGSNVGQALILRDGILKVTGGARYAADNHPPGMLYAILAVASISRGGSPPGPRRGKGASRRGRDLDARQQAGADAGFRTRSCTGSYTGSNCCRTTERTVTIVGVDEADMTMGKISLTPPIATPLIKARARRGDEVAVHTPRGVQIIEVLSVSYPSPAAPYEDVETGAQSGASANLWITGPSKALTRCQVLGETNSGCKLRRGRPRPACPTLSPPVQLEHLPLVGVPPSQSFPYKYLRQ